MFKNLDTACYVLVELPIDLLGKVYSVHGYEYLHRECRTTRDKQNQISVKVNCFYISFSFVMTFQNTGTCNLHYTAGQDPEHEIP